MIVVFTTSKRTKKQIQAQWNVEFVPKFQNLSLGIDKQLEHFITLTEFLRQTDKHSKLHG